MEYTVAQIWKVVMAELALVISILALLVSVGTLSGCLVYVFTGWRNNRGRIVETPSTEVTCSGSPTRQPTNAAILNAGEQSVPDLIPLQIKSAPLPQGGFGRKV